MAVKRVRPHSQRNKRGVWHGVRGYLAHTFRRATPQELAAKRAKKLAATKFKLEQERLRALILKERTEERRLKLETKLHKEEIKKEKVMRKNLSRGQRLRERENRLNERRERRFENEARAVRKEKREEERFQKHNANSALLASHTEDKIAAAENRTRELGGTPLRRIVPPPRIVTETATSQEVEP